MLFLISACGCPTKVNISNRPQVDILYNDANYISTERSTKNVAACKGKVHVAWFGKDNSGNQAVFYRRSIDGGATWDPPIQLTSFSNFHLEMWIQCFGDTVIVAYEKIGTGRDLYYRYSINGGTTWSPESPLEVGSYNQEAPSIWLWNNNFHLAWADNRPVFLISNYYIYYKRSVDMGLTWTPDNRRDISDSPVIVGDPANPNVLHIIFMIFNSFERKARYIRSTDNGNTWSATFDLSGGVNANGSGFWGRPIGYISAYNGVVHAVFVDDRYGNKEVLYRRSTNSGVSWSGIIRLTNTPGISWNPFILTDGMGQVRLYWVDNSDGDYEVMCKISNDNGLTWSADAKLTNNTARDVMVSVDYDPSTNRWNIVWASDESGNWEIYYTSDPCPLGNDEELGISENFRSSEPQIYGWGIKFNSSGEAKVYNLSGRLYKSVSVHPEYSLRLPKGVWFVRFKGKVYKIVVH